jgi:hypothetical protein
MYFSPRKRVAHMAHKLADDAENAHVMVVSAHEALAASTVKSTALFMTARALWA